MITRNVGDAILFNVVFSDCPTDAAPASLDGLRLGYVTDRFARVDKEVISHYIPLKGLDGRATSQLI